MASATFGESASVRLAGRVTEMAKRHPSVSFIGALDKNRAKMPWAEFHERHYELAMNRELLGPSTVFFAPPTHWEAFLGFDVVMWPGNPAAWPVVAGLPPIAAATGAPPLGLPPPGAPMSVSSLLLQYKRPEWLSGAAAKQAASRTSQFGRAGIPYLRVRLDNTRQHTSLANWEQALSGIAVVRYAAPCFHTYGAFLARQLLEIVFLESAFVSPLALGTSRRWTYAPGAVMHMRHSEPEQVAGDSPETLADQIRESATSGDHRVVREHLSEMAARTRDVFPESPARAALVEEIRRSSAEAEVAPLDSLEAAADAAVVAHAAARSDASWLLLTRDTMGNGLSQPSQ